MSSSTNTYTKGYSIPPELTPTNHQRELTARLAEALEGGPELSGARPARTEWIPGPYLPP